MLRMLFKLLSLFGRGCGGEKTMAKKTNRFPTLNKKQLREIGLEINKLRKKTPGLPNKYPKLDRLLMDVISEYLERKS